MREVEVRLQMKLSKAMSELRIWLDHHNCVPVSFDLVRASRRVTVARIVFAKDDSANLFLRDFGK